MRRMFINGTDRYDDETVRATPGKACTRCGRTVNLRWRKVFPTQPQWTVTPSPCQCGGSTFTSP